MANTILTSDILAREALMVLENNLVMGALSDRRYESEFSSGRQGDAIRVRRPSSFTAAEFTNNGTATVSNQDGTELATTLTLEKLYDVSFMVTAKEMALSIDDFSSNLMKPAMAAMAQQIDDYILSKYIEIGGMAEIAAAGTGISTLAHIAAIVQRLNEQKAPMQGRSLVVSPSVMTQLFAVSEFAKSNERGDNGTALREASLGRFMGMDVYMDQNINTHTTGTQRADRTLAVHADSTAVAKGATSFAIDGSSSGSTTILKGDVVRVTHPSGKNYDYVVTDTSVTGQNSKATLNISPPLYEAIDENDVVELPLSVTTSDQNIAFTENAIALAMVPLDVPMGPGTDSSVVSHNGYSMRASITYNHAKKIDEVSLDVLVGAKVVQPEMAVRIPTA
jgi:hypothetical protein